MSEKPLTEVRCTRTDCMYYEGAAAREGIILCSHRDKPLHLDQLPCPLYRLAWYRIAEKAQELARREDRRR